MVRMFQIGRSRGMRGCRGSRGAADRYGLRRDGLGVGIASRTRRRRCKTSRESARGWYLKVPIGGGHQLCAGVRRLGRDREEAIEGRAGVEVERVSRKAD